MTKPAPTRLLAGEIGKPHGLSGEVYVVAISDDPRRFEQGSILLRDDGSLVVEGSRTHGNRLLVKFEGIGTRDEAERLRGPVYVPVEEARSLEADEFWPHDLIGCLVRTPDDPDVGTVTEVFPGAAHDQLVVRTERGERMIPLVKDIVRKIDVEAGVIEVEPPSGLLD